MKLVEIRELDGPNVFLLKPAMKIEFDLEHDSDDSEAAQRLNGGDEFGVAIVAAIDAFHERAGLPGPDVVVTPMEIEGNVSAAFSWTSRRVGRLIAESVAALASGSPVDTEETDQAIAEALAHPVDADRPELITDAERKVPAIGITGTNGKTTTTRLLAHIAGVSGKRVGWCTTSGVFVDGVEVLNGDYTGPAGARRVLLDPDVEIAMLETARGGILLRGLGYESNDVSIFINVSPDHLGLLGIETVQGLAITKSTVTAVTKPDGMVVLNADDPLVWQFADTRPAPVLAVSKVPDSTVIQGHLAAGGSALILMNGEMVWHHDGQDTSVLRADEVPITFGGRALHMVENAMHATAGALAVGIDLESVREGLKTFRSDAGLNPGRLNLFRTADGVSVLIDFAHNEAGVQHLLSLATTFVEKGKKLRTVAGSAGDRPDESIRAMLQMAAKASNGGVYLRETSKYLRGRASNAALIDLYRDALKDVSAKDCGVWPSEFEATCQAVKDSSSGDVVAVMAYEQSADIRSWLLSTGATPASG